MRTSTVRDNYALFKFTGVLRNLLLLGLFFVLTSPVATAQQRYGAEFDPPVFVDLFEIAQDGDTDTVLDPVSGQRYRNKKTRLYDGAMFYSETSVDYLLERGFWVDSSSRLRRSNSRDSNGVWVRNESSDSIFMKDILTEELITAAPGGHSPSTHIPTTANPGYRALPPTQIYNNPSNDQVLIRRIVDNYNGFITYYRQPALTSVQRQALETRLAGLTPAQRQQAIAELNYGVDPANYARPNQFVYFPEIPGLISSPATNPVTVHPGYPPVSGAQGAQVQPVYPAPGGVQGAQVQPVYPAQGAQGAQVQPVYPAQGAQGAQVQPVYPAQGAQGAQVQPVYPAQGAQGAQVQPVYPAQGAQGAQVQPVYPAQGAQGAQVQPVYPAQGAQGAQVQPVYPAQGAQGAQVAPAGGLQQVQLNGQLYYILPNGAYVTPAQAERWGYIDGVPATGASTPAARGSSTRAASGDISAQQNNINEQNTIINALNQTISNGASVRNAAVRNPEFVDPAKIMRLDEVSSPNYKHVVPTEFGTFYSIQVNTKGWTNPWVTVELMNGADGSYFRLITMEEQQQIEKYVELRRDLAKAQGQTEEAKNWQRLRNRDSIGRYIQGKYREVREDALLDFSGAGAFSTAISGGSYAVGTPGGVSVTPGQAGQVYQGASIGANGQPVYPAQGSPGGQTLPVYPTQGASATGLPGAIGANGQPSTIATHGGGGVTGVVGPNGYQIVQGLNTYPDGTPVYRIRYFDSATGLYGKWHTIPFGVPVTGTPGNYQTAWTPGQVAPTTTPPGQGLTPPPAPGGQVTPTLPAAITSTPATQPAAGDVDTHLEIVGYTAQLVNSLTGEVLQTINLQYEEARGVESAFFESDEFNDLNPASQTLFRNAFENTTTYRNQRQGLGSN